MLSELYHIAKNLSHQEQEEYLVHVNFGDPGLSTKLNLQLLLGWDGRIVRLEALQAEDSASLWTLKQGNKRYFPAVRLSRPLISVLPTDPMWEEMKKNSAEVLRDLAANRKRDPKAMRFPLERKQAERILKWTHEDHDCLGRIQEFARHFLALTDDAERFGVQVSEAIDTALSKTSDDKSIKPLQEFLCGHLVKQKGKPDKTEGKAQLIFDYLPEGDAAGCLYSPRIGRVVLECLRGEKPTTTKKKRVVGEGSEMRQPDCAFEGRQMPLLTGPFSDWSAKPVIGKPFKPFSKFSEAPCNARYHVEGSAGFPIGAETADTLVAAGAAMTAPALRNKTWRSIRNGKLETVKGKKKEKKPDVLIAYPTFPWADLAPVSIFGKLGSKKESTEDAYDDEPDTPATSQVFAQVAESFVSALERLVPKSDLERQYIKLLILRPISDGAVQLAYSAMPTCRHFAAAVQHWVASEKNLPPRLTVPLPSKKAESGLGWFAPSLLFPDDAIHVFSHQWMRGGTESSRLQTPPVSVILDVFLQREGVWQGSARQLLETLLPRVEPLLIGAGNILHRLDREDTSAWRDFAPKTDAGQPDKSKPDPRYYLVKSLSLIGTLLHALNSTPNHYMKETSYLVGKLLAAMDELHKCYCISERKGDIPPTLMGNGLLGRAADSPEMAFDELCERSRIYLGWAKSVQLSGKETEALKIAVNSAKKLLRIVEPIAAELHQSATLKQSMSAEGKAHLFLGYLSPVLGGKKESDESTTASTQPE